MSEPLPGEFDAAMRRTAGRRGPFGARVSYFSEIGSTNDEAMRLADRGAPQGTTVVAAAQTAGRGRLGRTWYSPPGAGLYVSVIVRDPAAAPFLTLAGGVAVAEGIMTTSGLPVEIKWPNDVVVDGGLGRRRKLAGVLAEASTGGAGLQHVVLGFGINLRPAAYPPDIADRATSLEAELGRPADAGPLLSECLARLAEHVVALGHGTPQPLLERWLALSPSAFGAPVEWDAEEGVKRGRTAGIAGDGALLVRSAEGAERIISGAVRWS